MRLLTLFFATVFSTVVFASSPLLHQAALSPDGKQIAFSYQGDIWLVESTGGQARRLTIHESYESAPAWSPDGKQIAFVGNRYGNNDIFVVDTKGSAPKRLTFHSTSDNEPAWLSNEEILFTTRRIFAQVERIPEIYSVKTNGGTPVRYLEALGGAPSIDNGILAFTRGGCRISREAYRGPANRDIWLYNGKTDEYNQVTTDEGQDHAPLLRGSTLFYLSSKEGRYNIYKQDINASTATRVTNFKKWGIRSFDVSQDGQTIVIEKGGNLELSTNGGKRFNVLNIQVGSDFKFYPTEEKVVVSNIRDFALSPNEKYIAFESRGEIFIKPNDKEKSRSVNLSQDAYNDTRPTWLNDTMILFLSDRVAADVEKSNTPLKTRLLLRQSKKGEKSNPYLAFSYDTREILEGEQSISDYVLSPDRSKIAVVYGRGKLATYDIDSLGNINNEIVLLDGWDYPGGVSWSPDSKWLAYSLSDLDFNDEIYIHAADNHREPVNVSMHPRNDSSPNWSKDGSKLAFRSIRNNGDNDIWFVWLREEDYEKTQRDWEELEDWGKDDSTKDDDKDDIQIDFDGIHNRLEQVTSLPGNEGAPHFGPKGEFIYFTTNNGSRAGSEGSSDLMQIKWDGKEMKPLLPKTRVYNLQLDKAGGKFYLLTRGKIGSTALKRGKLESQAVKGRMHIDYMAERVHLLEDGWNALNAGFYDPAFHGQDWSALKEKYRPLIMAASTRQDFTAMYNDMLGQLNASHMGFISGKSDEDLQRVSTGYLGIELDDQGRVSKVLTDGPADRKKAKLEIGDKIVAINGQRIKPTDNLYSYLNGKANERIQLSVLRNGSEQNILLRPTRSVRNTNYEAWVNKRKELTEKYSGGRLGYIHIRGMNWSSFERFERELTAAGLGKDGIVIDVRFNGGGWTTDMLMTVLNVRQHAYTVPRGAAKSLKENKAFKDHYPYGERLPQAALVKPSIALCNEASYSNAEIFSHAYKHLGHGTLLGMPTFGAVISTGGQALLDGSFVRMPFRAWYVHATGENMEGGPAVPDIVLQNAPNDKSLNQDTQLKRAVDELLKQID